MSRDKQTVITDTENKSNNFEDKSNKQIEEMTSIITSADPYKLCKGQPCLTCEFQDIQKNCYSAKAIYNAGYRKASEVARDVADEITLAFYQEFDEIIPSIMADKIAELKKKYTEGRE